MQPYNAMDSMVSIDSLHILNAPIEVFGEGSQVDSLGNPVWKDCMARVFEWSQQQTELYGDAGMPVGYFIKNDDLASALLLLNFFIMAIIAIGSYRYISASLKDFFHIRQRSNLFAERSDTEMKGRWLFAMQSCVLLAVLYFCYMQDHLIGTAPSHSPHSLLLLLIVYCCSGYYLKYLLARIVGSVFFDSHSIRQWSDAYLLLSMLMGAALLPLILLKVYSDYDCQSLPYVVLALGFFSEILLIYRTYRVFFSRALGLVHLFLYLCALEILPLLFLWRGLIWVSTKIPTLY